MNEKRELHVGETRAMRCLPIEISENRKKSNIRKECFY